MAAIDLSKINQTVVEGPDNRLSISKITESVIEGPTIPVRIPKTNMYVVEGPSREPDQLSKINAYVIEGPDHPDTQFPIVPVASNREPNPYRPTIPKEVEDVDSILFKFMQEQSEILRQQHNLTQAGDTTFPWEELTKASPQKLYNAGSMGRFYHDDYGLVIARYVQFKEMRTQEYKFGPVGWLSDSDSVDWIVTNDLSKSARDLVAGIICTYNDIIEDEWGWIIVCGANITSLRVQDFLSTPFSNGQALSWYNFETVGVGIGRPIGRVWGADHGVALPPGSVFINIESFSAKDLENLILLANAEFQATIDNLLDRVTDLEAESGVVDFTSINTQLTAIRSRLTREEARRSQADSELRNLINSLSGLTELNAFKVEVDNRFNLLDDTLSIRITAAQGRADAAYALAAGIDSTAIWSAISGIQISLAAIRDELEAEAGATLPLVTGEVPPVLMYFDDGNLVRVEV